MLTAKIGEIEEIKARRVATGDYLGEAIKILNGEDNIQREKYGITTIPKEMYGITTVSISIKNPNFDEQSQLILSIKARADQEAEATKIQAEATAIAADKYVQKAIEISILPQEVQQKIMAWIRDDNKEALARQGVTTIIDIPQQGPQIIPFPLQQSPSKTTKKGKK